MRAIVHIGLPKTGTSSFQHLLFEQHDRLLENGIRVLAYDGPEDQFALPTRAFDLANCVVRTDLDVWWSAFIPESSLASFIERGRNSIRQQVLQPEELLIASAEDLFLIRTNEEVHRLKGLLEPREVSIVLTIRDRESWLRSLRAQLIAGPVMVTVPWSNPTKGWADAADPPAGTDDEIEWLRLRVLSQAWELERLRRVVARLRLLARPVELPLGSAPRTGRSSHLGQKRVRVRARSEQMGTIGRPPRRGRS
jgi:hypothetical protein